MTRSTRGLATLAALALAVGTAAAQPPRVQDMTFGGGAHFEFLIPVQAQGRIFAQATWAANVPIAAALYAPNRAHPVRVTRGTGLVQISQEVTSWRAGEHWLLKLTAEQDAPDLQGKLHVVWPAGNWPLAVVRWQNAGPLDPETRLALRDGVAHLREALATRGTLTSGGSADPVVRAELRQMATTLATRMEVLEQVPNRYVVNDLDPAGMTLHVGPQPSSPDRAVQASLLEVACLSHKPWHTHGESDAPFVVAVFLAEDGDRPSVARTTMFEAVHDGDAPIASAAGQELLRSDGSGATHLALALFDGEGDTPDASMARFQRTVELYQLYSALNGGDNPFTFAWLVAITSEGRDDVLGTRLIAIAPERDTLRPIARLSFTGHGARYEVAVQLQSR